MNSKNSDELSRPWIEVVAPSVFELADGQGSELRELQTGDELDEGMAIKTGEVGLANIYFPDGSVARLDSKTTIILESGRYDSGSLAVRINLLWGNVWSKIIALATPESYWEVTTSTAVATVRGTAFGVEYREEGKTGIVGYENKVEVRMVDPETKEIMKEVSMIVEPEKFLEVRKEAVLEMKSHLAKGEAEAAKAIMEVRQASKEVMERDWVKRAVEADQKLEAKLNELKEKIQTKSAAQRELRKELLEKTRAKVEEKREAVQEKAEVLKEDIQAKREEPINKIPEVIEAPKANIDAAQQKPKALPKGLEITTKESLVQVLENTPIVFRAILIMSDGTSVDVTDKVDWQVLGPIGRFEKPGVFVGKLDASVSELGEGTGTVIAAWKNSETGEAFLGKSAIFKVQPRVDLNFDPTRG